jgi:hypothetical protein
MFSLLVDDIENNVPSVCVERKNLHIQEPMTQGTLLLQLHLSLQLTMTNV